MIPKLTMSRTAMRPYEKAMALGGVATGNMKANDVAMATGIIKYRGF